MNTIAKLILILGLIGVAGAASINPALEYWKKRNRVTWVTDEVIKGNLEKVIKSTGSVKPVLSYSIGTFVSGPIDDLFVDFNDEVKENELLAMVDTRLFKAAVDRDEATLASREADLLRTEAQLRQALNNYQRGMKLREKNEDFLSNRELDQLVYEVKSLQAQRKLATAAIAQSKASLVSSKLNLEYCEIRSPVDGIVIDRLIDPGQTLAAQFQTPELFVVAPDLRKKIHIFASVDEADIGMIQEAMAEEEPVKFTVDAHPGDEFEGVIEQIRLSSATEQNVVTYPVVVAASNPDMKLLPGMTAVIDFNVKSIPNAIKVPFKAIQFVPDNPSQVRKKDRKLLDTSRWEPSRFGPPGRGRRGGSNEDEPKKKTDAARGKQRHVWVEQEDGLLRAVAIRTGLSDSEFAYTEVISGELSPGDLVVTGKEDPSKKKSFWDNDEEEDEKEEGEDDSE